MGGGYDLHRTRIRGPSLDFHLDGRLERVRNTVPTKQNVLILQQCPEPIQCTRMGKDLGCTCWCARDDAHSKSIPKGMIFTLNHECHCIGDLLIWDARHPVIHNDHFSGWAWASRCRITMWTTGLNIIFNIDLQVDTCTLFHAPIVGESPGVEIVRLVHGVSPPRPAPSALVPTPLLRLELCLPLSE